jgi:hypothetical protein
MQYIDLLKSQEGGFNFDLSQRNQMLSSKIENNQNIEF